MKHELKTEELSLFARIRRIDVKFITKLKEVLDAKQVRKVLIRYEYKERGKGGVLPKREIVNLLMKKYEVSRSTIESIIYEPQTSGRQKECVVCGRLTSYYRWSKYDGRCKKCMR